MKYKYKFSVIMCIYNVEKYLDEAIQCIIKQDIGFKENIQLILVNDGSPDNSEAICLNYQKMYPNNVFYKKKKNGGLSSAKNYGLDFIEGEYVSFFDSDDNLPANVFSEVYNFMKRNKQCVDFATIPLYFFEAQTGIHPKYQYMKKKNRIIDLLQEPYNFILSGAASFYKKEIFDSFRFDETYVGEEDTKLNGMLYSKNPRFGYVCQRGVKYNYRKRFEQTSIVDTAKVNPESYKTVIKLLDTIIPSEKMEKYHQELIIYELRSRIKQIDPGLFEDRAEYDEIIDNFSRIIRKLDPYYVAYESKFCDQMALKHAFFKLGNLDYSVLNKYMPSYSDISLQKNEISNNKLCTTLTFNRYSNDNLEVVALSNEEIIYPTVSKEFNSAFDVQIGEFIHDDTHLRKFEFDLSKNKLINFVFMNTETGYCYPARKIIPGIRDIFNSYNKHFYHNEYCIVFNGRKIEIKTTRHPKLSYLKRNLRTILAIYKNHKVLPITRLFKKDKPKYILINDRFDKAGDNGEALFKYINKYEPEMAKYTYFAISKKSPDYKRMKKYGKVVKHGSIKHRILFLNASHIYCSHTMPQFYNAYSTSKLRYFRDLFDYKFIWLQHGITQNDISAAANRYIKRIDYVTTATNPEFKEFSRENYCFDKGQVILTGFARYDFLEDNSKNIITLAPTWRRGFGLSDGRKEEFLDSDYYLNYSKILSNESLNKMLKEKNIELNFVLHPEMFNYLEDFEKFESDNIHIIHSEGVNYNRIFAESKLLITDYSSVFFDFAYLKKPEIFFQFDKEFFFKEHYKKGYFNFETDGFGDVVETPEKVIEKIKHYINNDFRMEDKYIKIVNNTFKYTDKNNCKRIVDITYKNDK